MDRRVFEPQSTNSQAHRRQALGMAIAVLAAGLLALNSLKTQRTVPAPPVRAPITPTVGQNVGVPR